MEGLLENRKSPSELARLSGATVFEDTGAPALNKRRCVVLARSRCGGRVHDDRVQKVACKADLESGGEGAVEAKMVRGFLSFQFQRLGVGVVSDALYAEIVEQYTLVSQFVRTSDAELYSRSPLIAETGEYPGLRKWRRGTGHHSCREFRKNEAARAEGQTFKAELIEVRGSESFCWIELAENLRVKVKIPSAPLQAADLVEGDEFFWQPHTHTARRIEHSGDDSEERQSLRAELDMLRRRFRDAANDVDMSEDAEA